MNQVERMGLTLAAAAVFLVVMCWVAGTVIESLGYGVCHDELLSDHGADNKECKHRMARIDTMAQRSENGVFEHAVVCKCGK